jgi:archaeal cell division control protein 6
MSLVEDALAGTSVFKDEAKLLFDYIPEELPHREDVLHRLVSFFRVVADGNGTQHVTLRGPVGSGKTAIARRFAIDLRDAMLKRHQKLHVSYVNCRNEKTPVTALLAVMRSLDPAFPDRGFAAPEMLDALRKQMAKRDISLLVILDEVDVLLKNKGADLLYSLSRFGQEGGVKGVSAIAISQRDIFKQLDEATASTFKRTNMITLEPYGKEAMDAIVTQRVKLAFHAGTVGEDVADLVADIASKKGDARLAIEILHHAGILANDEGNDQLTAEYVRKAKATIYSELPEHKLRELPRHELLVLLSVARRLAKTGAAYIMTGDAYEAYTLESEGHDEKPRGLTQYWDYLKSLESYGFLDLKKSGKGQAGTTHFISLPDAPAAELVQWLEAVVAEARP